MRKLEKRVAGYYRWKPRNWKRYSTEFAKQGANIAISYLSNEEAARATVAECEEYGVKAIAVQANAGDADDVNVWQIL